LKSAHSRPPKRDHFMAPDNQPVSANIGEPRVADERLAKERG
jgi:hypothetical protein